MPAPSATYYAEITNARARDGTPFTIGDLVVVRVRNRRTNSHLRRTGLVRRVFALHTSEYVHIHWTCASAAASKSPFLLHGSCQNVEVRHVLRLSPSPHPRFVTELDRVWRDHLPQGKHRPTETSDPFPETACDSCLSKHAEVAGKPRVRGDRFAIRGEVYHVGELVFLDNAAATGEPWGVGIVALGPENTWELRVCGRFSDLEGGGYVSERALYLTDEVIPCDLRSVVGKAPVNLPSDPDTFTLRNRLSGDRSLHVSNLVKLRSPPAPCATCYSPAYGSERAYFEQLRLPSAELYAGGGGSLFGFNKHFNVKYAVDNDRTACDTLRANFPQVHIYNGSVAQYSKSRRAPKPGSLAVLVAGPPCQGHSSLNPHAIPTDPRNLEVFVTLEEVARVIPDIFVMENVRGMKEGTGADINFAHEAVRRLVAMDYQVRIALLHSRDYGSPQRRVRLFFLAARSGIPLPPFPSPTHANPDARGTTFGLDGDVPFGLDVGRVNGTAALPAVTAYDALSDLPAWDHPPWVKEPGSSRSVVGPDVTAYAKAPLNDFQKIARRDSSGILHDHVTPLCTKRELDFIYNAPPPGQDAGLRGSEKRLDPTGGVPTLLTSPRPGQKATAPIHWDQNRIFTVAERRRIQGLPDSYVLCGDVEAQNQQLGNMIDAAVAGAVARSIKAVYEPFWRERGMPDSETFWRLWRQAHPV